VTVAAIGWFTSWATEAVSCPIVATLLACASSNCISRASASARFAAAQIEYERHALLAAFLKSRGADEDGDTTAIFAQILLLERLNNSDRPQLCHCPFVALLPLRWRQVPPVHTARDEILALVSHDPKERVVGLNEDAR
jgi:hypothetical protein